jgi:hypothetical protein
MPSIADMLRIVNPSGCSDNILRMAEISSGNFSSAIVIVHNTMRSIYFLAVPCINALHIVAFIFTIE